MKENEVFAGVLVLLVVATGLLVGVTDGTRGGPPNSPQAEPAFDTTANGVRYTVHPSELVRGCLTGKDCIKSIDDPEFQPAEEATELEPDERVIGVEIEGRAKAYPLRILQVHEVVNDELAGRPIAVTYCPLCRSGLTFSRTVEGRTLTFGVSGKLLDANLVLYDRQTETYWSQVMAEAIVGPLVPAQFKLVPSSITTWAEWRRSHPETRVLSGGPDSEAFRGYEHDRYQGYGESDHVGYGVRDVDDRFPTKEIVHGVTIGGASKAYPEEAVNERDVINDEVGGVPVLLVEDPREGSVKAFVRKRGNTTFRFALAGDGLVDGNGDRWGFDGEALEGPHRGTRLERVNSPGFYWFAWYSFNPDTAVFETGG